MVVVPRMHVVLPVADEVVPLTHVVLPLACKPLTHNIAPRSVLRLCHTQVASGFS